MYFIFLFALLLPPGASAEEKSGVQGLPPPVPRGEEAIQAYTTTLSSILGMFAISLPEVTSTTAPCGKTGQNGQKERYSVYLCKNDQEKKVRADLDGGMTTTYPDGSEKTVKADGTTVIFDSKKNILKVIAPKKDPSEKKKSKNLDGDDHHGSSTFSSKRGILYDVQSALDGDDGDLGFNFTNNEESTGQKSKFSTTNLLVYTPDPVGNLSFSVGAGSGTTETVFKENYSDFSRKADLEKYFVLQGGASLDIKSKTFSHCSLAVDAQLAFDHGKLNSESFIHITPGISETVFKSWDGSLTAQVGGALVFVYSPIQTSGEKPLNLLGEAFFNISKKIQNTNHVVGFKATWLANQGKELNPTEVSGFTLYLSPGSKSKKADPQSIDPPESSD